MEYGNNVLLAVDFGKCAVLIMTDLSALSAFAMIDHKALLDHIKYGVDIQGTTVK